MAKSSGEDEVICFKGPPEILQADAFIKLRYFCDESLIVNHDKLTKAIDDIYWELQGQLDQNFVMLIGPTGAGKTAASRMLVNRICREHRANYPDDLRTIPAIFQEAAMPHRATFEWKIFWQLILGKVHAPLPQSALPMSVRTVGSHSISIADSAFPRSNAVVGALRERAFEAMGNRKVQLLAIDEAEGMFRVNAKNSARIDVEQKRSSTEKAEIMKSLVNRNPAPILLVGPTELFESALASGQLSRRNQVIEFSRYKASPEGIGSFSKGVLGLLAHFPAPIELVPSTAVNELFFQSFGLIGQARKLLLNSLRICLRAGKPLTMEYLRLGYPRKLQHQAIKVDVERCEEVLRRYMEPQDFGDPDPSASVTTPMPVGQTKPGQRKPDRQWQAEDK